MKSNLVYAVCSDPNLFFAMRFLSNTRGKLRLKVKAMDLSLMIKEKHDCKENRIAGT